MEKLIRLTQKLHIFGTIKNTITLTFIAITVMIMMHKYFEFGPRNSLKIYIFVPKIA